MQDHIGAEGFAFEGWEVVLREVGVHEDEWELGTVFFERVR